MDTIIFLRETFAVLKALTSWKSSVNSAWSVLGRHICFYYTPKQSVPLHDRHW